MKYQKIANMLESRSDNLSKFKTRNWVEINNDSKENYTNCEIRFKTTILRSDPCDYADSYILVKGTIKLLEQEMIQLQDKQRKEVKE